MGGEDVSVSTRLVWIKDRWCAVDRFRLEDH